MRNQKCLQALAMLWACYAAYSLGRYSTEYALHNLLKGILQSRAASALFSDRWNRVPLQVVFTLELSRRLFMQNAHYTLELL